MSSSRWLARQKFTTRGNTQRAVITCALAVELAAKTIKTVRATISKIKTMITSQSRKITSRSTTGPGASLTKMQTMMIPNRTLDSPDSEELAKKGSEQN